MRYKNPFIHACSIDKERCINWNWKVWWKFLLAQDYKLFKDLIKWDISFFNKFLFLNAEDNISSIIWKNKLLCKIGEKRIRQIKHLRIKINLT